MGYLKQLDVSSLPVSMQTDLSGSPFSWCGHAPFSFVNASLQCYARNFLALLSKHAYLCVRRWSSLFGAHYVWIGRAGAVTGMHNDDEVIDLSTIGTTMRVHEHTRVIM